PVGKNQDVAGRRIGPAAPAGDRSVAGDGDVARRAQGDLAAIDAIAAFAGNATSADLDVMAGNDLDGAVARHHLRTRFQAVDVDDVAEVRRSAAEFRTRQDAARADDVARGDADGLPGVYAPAHDDHAAVAYRHRPGEHRLGGGGRGIAGRREEVVHEALGRREQGQRAGVDDAAGAHHDAVRV